MPRAVPAQLWLARALVCRHPSTCHHQPRHTLRTAAVHKRAAGRSRSAVGCDIGRRSGSHAHLKVQPVVGAALFDDLHDGTAERPRSAGHSNRDERPVTPKQSGRPHAACCGSPTSTLAHTCGAVTVSHTQQTPPPRYPCALAHAMARADTRRAPLPTLRVPSPLFSRSPTLPTKPPAPPKQLLSAAPHPYYTPPSHGRAIDRSAP